MMRKYARVYMMHPGTNQVNMHRWWVVSNVESLRLDPSAARVDLPEEPKKPRKTTANPSAMEDEDDEDDYSDNPHDPSDDEEEKEPDVPMPQAIHPASVSYPIPTAPPLV